MGDAAGDDHYYRCVGLAGRVPLCATIGRSTTDRDVALDAGRFVRAGLLVAADLLDRYPPLPQPAADGQYSARRHPLRHAGCDDSGREPDKRGGTLGLPEIYTPGPSNPG